MAGKIKGLTVVIDGETTKLSRAISSVNTQTRSLQRELKGCTTLLEKDPTNLDLITQKQKLLTSSLEEQKSKLQMLKEAEAQYHASATEHTEEEEREFRNLQREIASTENRVESLTRECVEFGTSASAASISAKEQLNKYATACETVGKKLVVCSAAVAAFGAAAVSSYAEVEEGAKAVVNATGATGEAAEELIGVYKNVAEDVVGSFDSIGGAVGEVNTRFGFTGEELEKCSESFVKFADITGSDAVTAVQLVSRYMGDAGVDAEDYGIVLDQLAVAAQASGISVDKLAESCTKYGAPMRALGFETQESIAIFSTWEKAGVNTEIAFSGMRKAISNWSAEGKDAREEFKLTLEEIANCPDIATATTKAIEAFGAKAGPDLADAIQGGRFEYSEMLALIEGSQGALESTYKEWEDGTNKGTKAIQNLKLTAAEFGETIVDMAVPAMESLSEMMQEVSEWWQSLDEDTKKNVVSMASIAAAVGPATLALGKLFGAASKIVGTYNSAKTAIDLFSQGVIYMGKSQDGAVASIDKVTAKTKLQTVAVNAAKGALVGLAAAGFALFLKAVKDAYDEQVKFTQATEGLTDAINTVDYSLTETNDSLSSVSTSAAQKSFIDLRKSIDETIESQASLADSFSQTWGEVNGNAAAIESFMGTIEALTGKYDENGNKVALTAEEQAKLEAAVAGVNDVCGTSYEVIDAQNGVLSESTDTIKANTDAWILNAKAQAAQEMLIELQKEQITLDQNKADAQEVYNAALAEYLEMEKAGVTNLDHYRGKVEEANLALEDATELYNANVEAQEDLVDVLVETQKESKSTVSAIKQHISESSKWSTALGKAGVDVDAFSQKLSNLGFSTEDLANLSEEQISTLISCYGEGMEEIISACEEAGIEIPEAMREAVEGAADEIEEGTPDAVDAMEELVEGVDGAASGLERDLGNSASKGSSAFASGIAGALGLTKVNAALMADAARGVKRDEGKAYTWGYHLGQKFASGINAATSLARNAAYAVADAVNRVIHFTHPDEGPLKQGTGIYGEHLVQDFAQGIKDKTKLAGDAATSLAGTVDKGLSSFSYESALSGLGGNASLPQESLALASAGATVGSGYAQGFTLEDLANAVTIAIENSNITANTYLNGEKISEELAPYSDVANGNRQALIERGLAQ